MSRKVRNWADDMYWQSATYNQALYDFFKSQLLNITLARFRWANLPPLCDQRYLEYTLLFQTQATLAFPKGTTPAQTVSLMAVPMSPPNAYGNYSRWQARGVNGATFDVDASNGVYIFDNMLRNCIVPQIGIIARELADIMRTKQINRMHVKTPFILVGARERKNDMVNIFKQVAGGEPAIITTEGFNDIDVKTLETGGTKVPYLGQQLQEDVYNTLNLFYRLIGLTANPYKAERQTNQEVSEYGQAADMTMLNPLGERRRAANEFNERFGTDIEVYVNSDWESDSYNTLNNIQSMLELGAKNDVAEGVRDSEHLRVQ